MTDMERKTFCAALSRYGAQAQITMVFEEMAELQDVLCKFLRGRVDGDTLANIAEEIADVGIMLDQMAIEFEVEDAVAEQRAHKVRRLRERIERMGEIIGKTLMRYVKRQPAADVVPVVRCKDCKHKGWVQEPCHGKSVDYCKIWDCTLRNLEATFCSYGEQKDGGADNA